MVQLAHRPLQLRAGDVVDAVRGPDGGQQRDALRPVPVFHRVFQALMVLMMMMMGVCVRGLGVNWGGGV